MDDLQTCPHCGAAVADKAKHIEWHVTLERRLASLEVQLGSS
jgi:hypothetical protein